MQIDKLLAAGQLESAKKVYELGAHSRSYAELSLGFDGLPGDVGVHTIASGISVSGEPITGVGIDEGKIGAKVIKIRYHNDENPVQCFVGGNPEPVTEGCTYIVLFERMNAVSHHEQVSLQRDSSPLTISTKLFRIRTMSSTKITTTVSWHGLACMPKPKCDLAPVANFLMTSTSTLSFMAKLILLTGGSWQR